MKTYTALSKKLYNENIHDGCPNYICAPNTILCNELKSQTFSFIKEHKAVRNLSEYLNYLESEPFSVKYLFILGLVFCIPDDKETEQAESDYWNKFKENISPGSSITQHIRDQVLFLISRFSHKHQIPFFDVYQNK